MSSEGRMVRRGTSHVWRVTVRAAPRRVDFDGQGLACDQQPGDHEQVTLVRRKVTLVRAGGDVPVLWERLSGWRATSVRIHEGDVGGDVGSGGKPPRWRTADRRILPVRPNIAIARVKASPTGT